MKPQKGTKKFLATKGTKSTKKNRRFLGEVVFVLFVPFVANRNK
ncbi:MAG TPA: hypothetical protein VE931_02765 [Pyrinomonadaceae bacterium]|nr:hypothetical protein [Pyrinomonadaceae bacterium]